MSLLIIGKLRFSDVIMRRHASTLVMSTIGTTEKGPLWVKYLPNTPVVARTGFKRSMGNLPFKDLNTYLKEYLPMDQE